MQSSQASSVSEKSPNSETRIFEQLSPIKPFQSHPPMFYIGIGRLLEELEYLSLPIKPHGPPSTATHGADEFFFKY